MKCYVYKVYRISSTIKYVLFGCVKNERRLLFWDGGSSFLSLTRPSSLTPSHASICHSLDLLHGFCIYYFCMWFTKERVEEDNYEAINFITYRHVNSGYYHMY